MSDIFSRVKRKVDKVLNQKCSYDYPPTSGGFKKHESNPVLYRQDGGSMFDPFVRVTDGRFVMCVSNRPDRSLELYTSDNGADWSLRCVALKAIPGTWEDNLNRGCFLIKDGVWYLYYTGQQNGISRIGLAKSDDGIHFSRAQSDPVVDPELAFETAAVMNPCVMYDEEKQLFRMWYAAGENFEPDVLAYAQSADGVNWTKRSQPVMTADPGTEYKKCKVGACDIIRMDDGRYCMAYITYQNVDVARIGLAYSDNGIDGWTDDKANPIISPEKNRWDANAVYKPSVCIKDGAMMLWYNGRSGSKESIGMAIKKEF